MRKRIIAIALTISSLLSMVSFTAYADVTDKFQADIDIISSLGIFSGLERTEGSYVTRGDFATWLSELYNVNTDVQPNKSPFNDVTSEMENYSGIVNAALNGIVHGEPGKNFYPDRVITYAEAATMAVNALGYYDILNSANKANGTYLQTATRIGLNKNLNAAADTKMTFGMSAKLLLNVGTTDVLTKSLSKDDYEVNRGETLLWNKHKIATYDGIVEANEFTSLRSKTGTKAGTVVIGGVKFILNDWSDAYSKIGCEVECWYKEGDDSSTALYLDDRKCDVTIFEAGDLEHKNGYLYTDNERKKEKIAADASVIYNGVFTTEYYPGGEDIFVPDNGYVKFINNDSDADADVIVIISYENMIVSNVRTDAKVINNKYDSTNSLDFAKAEKNGQKWILTDTTGAEIAISEVAANNVVSVARSEGSKVLWAVVSSSTVAGKIIAMQLDEDGNQLITIDDETYMVAQSYIDDIAVLPKNGDEVTLYFDCSGKIADIKQTMEDNKKYGFFIGADVYENEGLIRLNMMYTTGYGGYVCYEAADKVRIDGETFKKNGSGRYNLYTYLSETGYSRSSDAIVQNNENILEPYQVVIYSLNDEGKVNYIDTVRDNPTKEGENRLRLLNSGKTASNYYFQSTLRYFFLTGSERYSIPLGANTMLMSTPTLADRDNQFGYKILRQNQVHEFKTVKEDNRIYYNLLAYTTVPDGLTPELIHIPVAEDDVAKISMRNEQGLVTNVEEVLNVDNEPCYRITYIYGSWGTRTKYTEPGVAVPANLQGGDYAVFTLSYEGNITGVKQAAVLDEENKTYTMVSSLIPTDNTISSGNKFITGWNYATEENIFYVLKTFPVGSEPDLMAMPISSSYAKLLIMTGEGRKKQTEEISLSNIGQIQNYLKDNKKVPILIYITDGVPRLVVVYDAEE